MTAISPQPRCVNDWTVTTRILVMYGEAEPVLSTSPEQWLTHCGLVTPYGITVLGLFHERFFVCNSNLKEISSDCNSINGHQIATKFGICHDSTFAMPCAKLCIDHFIRIDMKVAQNFHWIWNVLGKTFMKWVPGWTLDQAMMAWCLFGAVNWTLRNTFQRNLSQNIGNFIWWNLFENAISKMTAILVFMPWCVNSWPHMDVNNLVIIAMGWCWAFN